MSPVRGSSAPESIVATINPTFIDLKAPGETEAI
jgi:hypothetical protein